MSRIVVDTDVASYIFNWHSLAQQYAACALFSRILEGGAMSLVFEWDPRKARSNLQKHRVSFTEAISVFSNPLARIFPDEDHSIEEPREIIIGHSSAQRLL